MVMILVQPHPTSRVMQKKKEQKTGVKKVWGSPGLETKRGYSARETRSGLPQEKVRTVMIVGGS